MDAFARLAAAGCAGVAALAERFEAPRVDEYLAFLQDHEGSGGFFSAADAGRILTRHLHDCLVFVHQVAERCSVEPGHHVADVGSGPGLPGYLFACLRQPPRVTLIDASRRRLGLLEEWFRARHGAANGAGTGRGVQFCYARAETLQAGLPSEAGPGACPTGVVARAFLPFPFSIEAVCGLQRPGGWVALAAGSWVEPEERVRARLAELGYRITVAEPLPWLQSLGERHLVLLAKDRPAAAGFPRPWPRLRRELRRWGL